MEIHVHRMTHPGLAREDNQDASAIAWLDSGLLLAVADGMGGHEGGARAAQLAIEHLVDRSSEFEEGDARAVLRSGILAAHEAIRAEQATDERLRRMGTTVVCAFVDDGEAHVAWVGDSRLYHFRRGHLEAVTKDHSVVERKLSEETITETEARYCEERNKITRALGAIPKDGPFRPAVLKAPLRLETGDSLVLCSDGLSDLVSGDEIAELLGGKSAEAGATELIEVALERGAPDNVTVIVAHVGEDRGVAPVEDIPRPRARSSSKRWGLQVTAGVALVLAGVALLLFYLLAGEAQAQGFGPTYCVGAPGACNTPSVRAMHGQWHFHCFVARQRGGCYECYDEVDSTCVSIFLMENPGWVAVGFPAECQNVRGFAPTSEGVFVHKIRGETVNNEPPPQTVPLEVRVERTGVGPVVAGEEVELQAVLEDTSGSRRAHGSGTFIIEDENGQQRTVQAEIVGGDRAVARFAVPPDAGRLRVRYQPADVAQGNKESIELRDSGGTLELAVERCPVRGVVDTEGGLQLAGAEVEINGHLEWVDALELDDATLAQLAPELVLTGPEGTQRFPAQLDRSGQVVGSIQLPDLDEAGDVRVGLLGRYGALSICSRTDTLIRVTPHGVELQAEPPERCFVGRPCRVGFRARVAPGPARARSRAALADPRLPVSGKIGSTEVEVEHSGAPDVFTIEHSFQRVGIQFLSLQLTLGSHDVRAMGQVPVTEPLHLEGPSLLDFGTLPHAEVTCQVIDLTGSLGYEGEDVLAISVEGLPEGCETQMRLEQQLANGRAQRFLVRPGEKLYPLLVEPDGLSLCLFGPRCPRRLEAPEGASVQVSSLQEAFPEESLSIALRYRIEPRSLLACAQGVLKLVASILGVFLLILGFRLPRRFGPSDRIQLSQRPEDLGKAGFRVLRQEPGGRAGWYRSARVRFTASADPARSARAAVLSLVPGTDGGVLATRGSASLSKQNRRTRKMEPVEISKGGAELARGTIYQSGNLFFRIQ